MGLDKSWRGLDVPSPEVTGGLEAASEASRGERVGLKNGSVVRFPIRDAAFEAGRWKSPVRVYMYRYQSFRGAARKP